MSSTGLIGKPLPMDKISQGISSLVSQLDYDDKGSDQAILTTDTVTKSYSLSFYLDDKEVRISGIAKGSGMIHPSMATMLAYITTDCAIDADLLDAFMKEAVGESFHAITVDGDQSTNDTVLILSSSLAGNKIIKDALSEEAQMFRFYLKALLKQLARDIVIDGEGATKEIEICVKGACSYKDALIVAKAIACSSLVKTAIFGEDPNWGRILASAGSCGVSIDPLLCKLTLQGCLIFSSGELILENKSDLEQSMKEKIIQITLELGSGDYSAHVVTSDLSYEYVKINAEYHT